MNNFKCYFEDWLKEHIGSFKLVLIKHDNGIFRVSYYKKLFNYRTILMVIRPPILFNLHSKKFVYNDRLTFDFMLYDYETDIVLGHISELDIYDWKDDLLEHIYLSEDRLIRSFCPCGDNFWLVQKENVYGHKFIGCSDYPNCEFSCEINDIYD